MTVISDHSEPGIGLAGLYRRAMKLPERIPFSLVQLAARLAIAHVFWQSAQSKLASWPVTLQLFANEYDLPFIDPTVAAPLATTAEITGSILVCLGLFSRIGALILLGITSTIQIFVYPQNWPDHLLWASLLLVVLTRGAGAISVDYLAERLVAARSR